MSRQHTAKSQGEARVRLVCDECEMTEWIGVTFRDVEDPCLVDIAIFGSDDWQYADDSIVCSDECARKFWDQ